MSVDRKPSKPWRVAWRPGGFSADYRSQRATYEAVRSLANQPQITRITVHHWEGGSWRLFERIEPSS